MDHLLHSRQNKLFGFVNKKMFLKKRTKQKGKNIFFLSANIRIKLHDIAMTLKIPDITNNLIYFSPMEK